MLPQLPCHHRQGQRTAYATVEVHIHWLWPAAICNLPHTAITFHHLFTISLRAQNVPFQKILSSTLVCFCLSDWSHGSRLFTGLICSSVLCFSSIFFVLVIPKCGRLSWSALWSTFRRTIKEFDWSIWPLYFYFYWPPPELLAGSYGTLVFCGTPLENQCIIRGDGAVLLECRSWRGRMTSSAGSTSATFNKEYTRSSLKRRKLRRWDIFWPHFALYFEFHSVVWF